MTAYLEDKAKIEEGKTYNMSDVSIVDFVKECHNMTLFHFDPDIKNTLTKSAMEIHRAFVNFDVSRDDVFKQQRGKDAAEVSREFEHHIEGIKKEKKQNPWAR